MEKVDYCQVVHTDCGGPIGIFAGDSGNLTFMCGKCFVAWGVGLLVLADEWRAIKAGEKDTIQFPYPANLGNANDPSPEVDILQRTEGE